MNSTRSTVSTHERGASRKSLSALFGGAVGIAFAPIFVRLSEVGPSATAFWRLALALPALWLWVGIEARGKARPVSPHA